MPTDPDDTSDDDHLLVGVKMLLGDRYTADQIAEALVKGLPFSLSHALMYALERRSDVVQLITIDVDEVLDEIASQGLIPTSAAYTGVEDAAFKKHVRGQMTSMYNDETCSERKFAVIDAFIGELKDEGFLTKSTTPDEAVGDGAGDGV